MEGCRVDATSSLTPPPAELFTRGVEVSHVLRHRGVRVEDGVGLDEPYSCCSALTGSSRSARRAGTKQAVSAMAASSAETTKRTPGSTAVTANRTSDR